MIKREERAMRTELGATGKAGEKLPRGK